MGIIFKAYKTYQMTTSRAVVRLYDEVAAALDVAGQVLTVLAESYEQTSEITEKVLDDYEESVNSFSDHFRYSVKQYADAFGLINAAVNGNGYDFDQVVYSHKDLFEDVDEEEIVSVTEHFDRDGYSYSEFKLADDEPIKGWSEV